MAILYFKFVLVLVFLFNHVTPNKAIKPLRSMDLLIFLKNTEKTLLRREDNKKTAIKETDDDWHCIYIFEDCS